MAVLFTLGSWRLSGQCQRNPEKGRRCCQLTLEVAHPCTHHHEQNHSGPQHRSVSSQTDSIVSHQGSLCPSGTEYKWPISLISRARSHLHFVRAGGPMWCPLRSPAIQCSHFDFIKICSWEWDSFLTVLGFSAPRAQMQTSPFLFAAASCGFVILKTAPVVQACWLWIPFWLLLTCIGLHLSFTASSSPGKAEVEKDVNKKSWHRSWDAVRCSSSPFSLSVPRFIPCSPWSGSRLVHADRLDPGPL